MSYPSNVTTSTSEDGASSSFLLADGPEVTVHKIDFKNVLPEYDGYYAVVLDNVLSAAECEKVVALAEASNNGVWDQALVNVGLGEQKLLPDVRKCGRIILDDTVLARRIWDRVKDHVSEITTIDGLASIAGYRRRQETWQLTRPNERLRFLKYGPGDFFAPHKDGTYETPDMTERSFYTLQLYLNESDPNNPGGEVTGGATTFHSLRGNSSLNVESKIGRVLIFQQRGLLHSGQRVAAGTKLTIRTDIMFKRVE